MPLVRVPIAGTIGKAVRINTDATLGAQIGSNFLLPDGSKPSLAELADALYEASPPSFVPDTSSGSLGFVFESDIIDGILLARVADDEVITGAWDFNAVTDFNANVNINGATLNIFDSSGADSLAMSTDGVDFDFAFIGISSIFFTGAVASYQFDRGVAIVATSTQPFTTSDTVGQVTVQLFPGSLTQSGAGAGVFVASGMNTFRFLGGQEVRVYDTTGADYIGTSHDGVNALTQYFQTSRHFYRDGVDPRWFDATNVFFFGWSVGSNSILFDAHASINSWQLETDGDLYHTFFLDATLGGHTIFKGGALQLRDSLNTDFINIVHDGVDVNFTHLNTANWNISGITAILAGAVDADFDAITATSYGGILEANLLDRTVAEIVTARWEFEGDGSQAQLRVVDSDSNGAATRAFIEFMGKGDVLTGRMGYLSASDGILSLDNALPNAGVELCSNSVQKLLADINGITLSDTLFVEHTSGEKIVLTDTNSTGNAVLNFIAFKDMNDLRQGVVGFGSSGNDDLIVQTDAGFGDVILKPQGANVLRASNTAVAISVPLTATSYDGILAANLLDKTAAEEVVGTWDFDTLRIVDSGDTDFVTFSHNGTDLLATGTNTGAFDIIGMNLRVKGGQTFLIMSSAGNDFVAFNHDGVDFSLVGTNTANWDISGITAILAGTVDADFDAITGTSIATGLGTVGAPSRFFEGDTDTGDFSPGANIYAITVGGVEAVRYTGASAPLIRTGINSGVTASTTQTQAGATLLTASWNEVAVVANNNDAVVLPSMVKGETCVVINSSDKKLQVFPALGKDGGAGINASLSVKANSSRYWFHYDDVVGFDIATDFKKLQGVEIGGATDNDLFYRSGGDWKHTDGKLTWDSSNLSATNIGGILEANLLDKAATETIAGTWTVDAIIPTLAGTLVVNGHKIVSTANGDIDIEPDGTGNVLLGSMTFDADQDIQTGGGMDNFVLTYDDGTGLISLEAAAGGGMVTGISKNSGTNVNAANRSVLNFIEGSNITLTIADDAGGDEVDITIAAAAGGGMVTGISKNSGTNVNAANRSVLNFIEGSNITLTIADDTGGDEVDITIAAAAGGSAILGHSGATSTIPKDSTDYIGFGSGGVQGTEANAEFYVPIAGTVRNLRTYVSANASNNAGNNITIRKNGSGTSLGTTYGAAETGLKSDTSDSFTVVAGDRISIEVVNTGSGGGTKNIDLETVTMELA